MTSQDLCPTLIGVRYQPEPINKLAEILDNRNDKNIIQVLQQALIMAHEGVSISSLLIPIIKNATPSKDMTVKRLLQLLWPLIDMYDASGEMKPEMIMVCNCLITDLDSDADYVVSSTLRSLISLPGEIIEQLVPSLLGLLNKKSAKIRGDAVAVIHALYKRFPDLMVNSPELVVELLVNENNGQVVRKAIRMLCDVNAELAVEAMNKSPTLNTVPQIPSLKLAFISATRAINSVFPSAREVILNGLANLSDLELKSKEPNTVVMYELALTLTQISTAPDILSLSARLLIKLALLSHHDAVVNSVIAQLKAIRDLRPHAVKLEDLSELFLAVQARPGLRENITALMMDTINESDVTFVLELLLNTIPKENIAGPENLLKNIHSIMATYPDHLTSLIPLLAEKLLLFPNIAPKYFAASCASIFSILYDKDLVVATNFSISLLASCKNPVILRAALHIISAKAPVEMLYYVMNSLMQLLSAPFVEDVAQEVSTYIAADGTYAQTSSPRASELSLLMETNNFLAASFVSAYSRAYLRLFNASFNESLADNRRRALHLCKLVANRVTDADKLSYELLNDTFAALLNPAAPTPLLAEVEPKFGYTAAERKDATHELVGVSAQLNLDILGDSSQKIDPILTQGIEQFSALTIISNDARLSFDSLEELRRMSQVYALSGHAERIYTEAVVTINNLNVSVTLLHYNRSPKPVTDFEIRLDMLGDHESAVTSKKMNLEPLQTVMHTLCLRMMSASRAVLIGNVSYRVGGKSIMCLLNEVHLNVAEFMRPEVIDEATFKSNWNLFEWENKISVMSDLDVETLADKIVDATASYSLVASPHTKDFYITNLSCSSSFNDSALINLSLLQSGNKTIGTVRIRTRKQALAVSLGETIKKLT